ncbi:MAG: tetratricopeptide repeat protein [Bacteroidia bacterium]|nr:tetratricopeptide repeat protein [Bacteroidia bacterium]
MAEETKDEPIIDVQEAYSKTEQYIEENKQSLSIILGVIVALVGIYVAWKYWYVAGQEKEAQKELFMSETYFEKDSLNQAINGDGQSIGFAGIVDQYGVTPSGNLAEYYLGVGYLKKGEYEKAIEHLKEFDSDDQMVAPIAIGAIGDCYVELSKVEEGISFYLKAAEHSKNKFTSPIYLKKAGLAYESLNNYKDAIKVYERIKTDFEKSTEAKDIDKFIARAKALAGE